MSSLLGAFILGIDKLSGDEGSLAALLLSVGSNPKWLRPAANGDARAIAVEIALPTSADSILGVMVLGTGKLSGVGWYPVTDRWTGCSIDLGSPDGTASIGVMSLTLDNADGTMSPWSSTFPRGANAYAGPGTLIRVTTYVGFTSEWTCQFTGIIESWNVRTTAFGRDSEVTITAAETIRQLAQVNDVALPFVEGGGEFTADRIIRLLTAAGWPYGLDQNGGYATTHQSTDMAANRLAELYLTADSANLTFGADEWGRAYIGPDTTGATSIYVPEYVVDGSVELANDDDLVLNVVALATTGGTASTWESSVSIGRFGRRGTQRFDLNATIGTNLAPIATRMLAEGAATLRPVSFELDNGSGVFSPERIQQFLTLRYSLDLTDVHLNFTDFHVAQLHHEMAPLGADDLAWNTTVSLRPTATSAVVVI